MSNRTAKQSGGKIGDAYVLAGKSPGQVIFDEREIDLIFAARVILLTGWTYDEYLAQPLEIVDAVLQIHSAQNELDAWAQNQAIKQARAKRR